MLMDSLFAETVPDAAKGAALALLRVKGATGAELAALVRALKRHSEIPGVPHAEGLLDTCGTGGGAPSFNLSTAAALIAAGAGVPLAKHGNRAVTSKCGSADVLEHFGVNLTPSLSVLTACLRDAGIAFLFAPAHHAAMKRVASVRSQLGFRTVFNQLGPLANPFGARRQLLGVYDGSFLRPMAEAARDLGIESALVVHGEDSLDEISPVTATKAMYLKDGELTSITFEPSSFGLEPLDPIDLAQAETIAGAAELVREAITNPDSPRCRAVLPNAAAALVLAGKAFGWKEGAELARATVASGAAAEALARLIKASQAESTTV